jgi:PAS domain-containing protein
MHEPAAESRRRLLLCDGPGYHLEDLLPFFRSLDYACTYVQEIHELRARGVQADAIIASDSIAGGPRGAAFTHIRRTFPTRPVLVVAHLRSLATAVGFFRAGVADYLSAPLRAEETRERIEAAIRARAGRGAGEAPDDEPVEVAVVPAEAVPDAAGGPAAQEGNGWISLETLPCAALVFGGDGRLRDANGLALELLGHPGVGGLRLAFDHGLADCAPLDERAAPLAPDRWPVRRALRSGRREAATVGLLRPDRRRVWVRLEVRPRRADGRIRDVIATLSDVTPVADSSAPPLHTSES